MLLKFLLLMYVVEIQFLCSEPC